MADSKRKVKVICEVCKGNGFVKSHMSNQEKNNGLIVTFATTRAK